MSIFLPKNVLKNESLEMISVSSSSYFSSIALAFENSSRRIVMEMTVALRNKLLTLIWRMSPKHSFLSQDIMC